MSDQPNGICTFLSNHSVEHTVEAISRILATKKVKLFAKIPPHLAQCP